jgi:predicted dehydrogenase
MNTVRVGVVGVGSLGQHHARIYGSVPGAELVGVYDASRKQAKAVAAQNGCRAFDSLEALAAETDALSLAVPTDLHGEIGARLIRLGKHLLIEKPIASTTAEAEELVELSRQHNTLLQVGHIERFNPVMSFLEKQLENTPPRFIEAHRLAPYPPARKGAPPRGTEVSVVLDLMIHDLEVILHLVRSPVKELRAVGVPVLSRTEDISNVRLEFENGAVANVTVSRISPERMRKIRVFTEDSYLSLDYQNQSGEIFSKGRLGISRKKIPVEKGDQLTRELTAFVECAATRGTPAVNGEQASEALKLAMAVIRQSQERCHE